MTSIRRWSPRFTTTFCALARSSDRPTRLTPRDIRSATLQNSFKMGHRTTVGCLRDAAPTPMLPLQVKKRTAVAADAEPEAAADAANYGSASAASEAGSTRVRPLPDIT